MSSATSPPVAAILVDLFSPAGTHTSSDEHHERLWGAVSCLLHNELQDHELVQLYALTSSDEIRSPTPSACASSHLERAGASVDRLVTTIVAADDKIRAFYEAKQALDVKEVTEIRLVCCQSQHPYWTAVCQVLFTPVHNWRVDSAQVQTITSDKAGKNLTENPPVSCVTADGPVHPSPTTEAALVSEENNAVLESVRTSIRQFLTTLPSLLGEPEVNRSEVIPRGVFVHGYSTRRGGVSTIPTMSAMNLVYTSKKRDPRVLVEENRRRLARVGGFDHTQFHIVKTEHGHRVWVVGEDQPLQFDGLVTNQPGVTLAAAGADCIPLLFADPVAMVIGAAHAGWRGTVEGVAGCVVRTMVEHFGCKAENVRVAMGPCVLPGCFRVLLEEAKRFSDIDPSCVVPSVTAGTHAWDMAGSDSRMHARRVDSQEPPRPAGAPGNALILRKDRELQHSSSEDASKVVIPKKPKLRMKDEEGRGKDPNASGFKVGPESLLSPCIRQGNGDSPVVSRQPNFARSAQTPDQTSSRANSEAREHAPETSVTKTAGGETAAASPERCCPGGPSPRSEAAGNHVTRQDDADSSGTEPDNVGSSEHAAGSDRSDMNVPAVASEEPTPTADSTHQRDPSGEIITPNNVEKGKDLNSVHDVSRLATPLNGQPQKQQAGRVAVDLLRANRVILEREGVLAEHIDTSTAPCTRCNPHLYFSYERDGFPFGNQIGFISILPQAQQSSP